MTANGLSVAPDYGEQASLVIARPRRSILPAASGTGIRGIGQGLRHLRQERPICQDRWVYDPSRENRLYMSAGIRTPQSNDHASAKASGA